MISATASTIRSTPFFAFSLASATSLVTGSARSATTCRPRRPRIGYSSFTSPLTPTLPSSCLFSTTGARRKAVEMTVATDQPPAIAQGPKWVLEYDTLDSPELTADISKSEELTKSVAASGEKLKGFLATAREISLVSATAENIPSTITQMTKDYWASVILLRNVATQASCIASCDGADDQAKKMSANMQVKFSQLKQAYEPASLFLDLCTDEVFDAIIVNSTDDEIKAAEYVFKHSRKMKDHKLSLDEENILSTMGVTGHSAWGMLYSDLSSSIKVNVKMPDGSTKEMGIASADAMRDNKDPALRKASWEAIREGWLPHQETCAATLNAITGWRADLYKKRGMTSYLTSTLHQNRMSEASLRAIFEAIDTTGVNVGRKALKVQARALGSETLNPWDLYAPAPVSNQTEKLYSFDEGIDLIANAVGEVDEEAGEFVRMMKEKKWIEASRGDTKRPGAFCTGFSKSRTPRVYLSDYNGGAALLLTLAHELGHAFHNWVIRDLPMSQTGYPMNLAETASIFFETVVGNKLVEEATNPEERFGMLWGEAESAGAFMLNIPSRYRFEEELNERRKESGPLSTSEIDDMMVRAWKRYYGETLAPEQIDRVGVFSQSKLHFYLTGISFYNWPYTFGYLYALGVYARYQQVGKEGVNGVPFSQMYKNLLRDTGRMDSEEVVKKHLQADIEDPQFWKDAIAVAEAKVNLLEEAAIKIGKI